MSTLKDKISVITESNSIRNHKIIPQHIHIRQTDTFLVQTASFIHLHIVKFRSRTVEITDSFNLLVLHAESAVQLEVENILPTGHACHHEGF